MRGRKGRARRETHMPITSSQTTIDGSSCPTRRATWEAAATPTRKRTAARVACWARASLWRGQKSSTPTAEPAVPGAKGAYPEPKPVARTVAQAVIRRGRRAAGAAGSAMDGDHILASAEAALGVAGGHAHRVGMGDDHAAPPSAGGAQVLAPCHVDVHLGRGSGVAEKSRDLRRLPEILPRRAALRVPEDDVGTGDVPGMQPHVLRTRHVKGQVVVLPRPFPHQQREAARGEVVAGAGGRRPARPPPPPPPPPPPGGAPGGAGSRLSGAGAPR